MVSVDPKLVTADSVDFYINTKCNLSCSTCFLGDEYFSKNNSMSLSSASDYIDYLSQTNIQDVALLGGEPTLHPNFMDLLYLFRSKVPHWSIRLVTNGNKFSRAKFSEYRNLLDAIYISLDSPTEKRNDLIRGQGSFSDAYSLLKLSSSSSLKTVLNMCVSRMNLSDLPGMFELAADLKVYRLNIHWTSPTGRAVNSKISLGYEEWQECIKEFKILSNKFKDIIKSDIQTAYKDNNYGNFSCAIKKISNIQVFSDGSVYLCGLHVDNPKMSSLRFNRKELFFTSHEGEAKILYGPSCSFCPSKVRGEQNAACIYDRTFS